MAYLLIMLLVGVDAFMLLMLIGALLKLKTNERKLDALACAFFVHLVESGDISEDATPNSKFIAQVKADLKRQKEVRDIHAETGHDV